MRELHGQVAEAADALYGDQVAGAQPRVPQAVERRDAGAEERRRLGVAELVGDARERFGAREHVRRVTAVVGDARDLLLAAGDEVADAARVAHEAVAAVPADARRDRPAATAAPCADLVDDRGDLVSRTRGSARPGNCPPWTSTSL
jgi:hypothetical protein